MSLQALVAVQCVDAVTGACCRRGEAACISTLDESECLTGFPTAVFLRNRGCALNNPCPFVTSFETPSSLDATAAGVALTIRAQRFTRAVHRDLPSQVFWGYNGQYPGPTILTTAGVALNVTWVNDLKDASGNFLTHHDYVVDTCLHGPDVWKDSARIVTHLHGGRNRGDSDGHPDYHLLPSQSATFQYPNAHDRATTLWYHDHALGITRLNVMMVCTTVGLSLPAPCSREYAGSRGIVGHL
jgi:hypothetical protein